MEFLILAAPAAAVMCLLDSDGSLDKKHPVLSMLALYAIAAFFGWLIYS